MTARESRVGIYRAIGRQPIFAFGNSDGDLQMLQWTQGGPDGKGPRFMGLVHHTDAVREWAYDRQSKIGKLDKALDAAGSEWLDRRRHEDGLEEGLRLSIGRDGRVAVAAGTEGVSRENAMARDPVSRLVKGFLSIGFKHQPLTWSPASGIHGVVVLEREFALVVVRVLIRTQVDIALRTAQGAEELCEGPPGPEYR